VIELNEAFAAQSLAVIKEAGLDPEKVNPNGGAIALGHPLGCTGAKLTATIIRELKRRNAHYGLVTMCVGGGMGAAGHFRRPLTTEDTEVTEESHFIVASSFRLHPLNAIPQVGQVEVNEKTGALAAEPHVGKRLCVMNRGMASTH